MRRSTWAGPDELLQEYVPPDIFWGLVGHEGLGPFIEALVEHRIVEAQAEPTSQRNLRLKLGKKNLSVRLRPDLPTDVLALLSKGLLSGAIVVFLHWLAGDPNALEMLSDHLKCPPDEVQQLLPAAAAACVLNMVMSRFLELTSIQTAVCDTVARLTRTKKAGGATGEALYPTTAEVIAATRSASDASSVTLALGELYARSVLDRIDPSKGRRSVRWRCPGIW